MMPLSDDLRPLLGLTERDRVEDLGSFEPPAEGTGHGLASAAATRPVWDRIDASPQFDPLEVSALRHSAVKLARWAPEPSIVLVEAPAAIVRVRAGSTRAMGDDLVALDGRTSHAAVSVDAPEGELFVSNDRGHVRVLRVVRSCPVVEALEALPPSAEAVLPVVPAPEEALDGLACAEWLRRSVERLARSVVWTDRWAALGQLARLWLPEDDASRRAFAQGELETPVDRVRDWARRLSPEQLRALARAAHLEADALEDALPLLVREVVSDPETAGESVLDFLHRRDDLASLKWVLVAADQGPLVSDRLSTLDDLASVHASAFATPSAVSHDERLRAVSWMEPEAWWGALLPE